MRRASALAFAFAFAAAPRSSRADGTAYRIVDNDHKKSIACKTGDTAEIAGNGNTVAVTGACASVRISGNGNKVTIDQAGAIDAPGNKNTITWHGGLAGKDPQVSNLGTDNTVTKSK
jgi:hypothetical protein